MRKCPTCDGAGVIDRPDRRDICPDCRGSGLVASAAIARTPRARLEDGES